MGEIERLLPGTKVSDWASTAIAAALPTTYVALGAYFAGGEIGATVAATVNKFAFADDSRTTLGTGLAAATYNIAGAANSGVAAYFAGGTVADWSTKTDAIDKFAFADDSRTTIGTGLSADRRLLGGAANSGTAAYWAGGRETGGGITTVDKTAFSDDSRTTLGTGLAAGHWGLSGLANSGTAAYFGGQNGTVNIDKFAFSDDSRTTLAAGLSAERYYTGAAANSGTAGYWAGGSFSGTVVDKFAFSNDSRTTLGTGLSAATRGLAGAAQSGTAAYFAGGYVDAGRTDKVEKFAFSDDGRSVLSTGLAATTWMLAGAANSGTL